ncbi:STM4013/SEN3800 family hydrolase [Gynuella sp.]|uniref:STM4013/SEN3800 family hydrolase n=1 Tax=Gynuella sp. TaxID=2969146 RepID=UPI003D102B2D
MLDMNNLAGKTDIVLITLDTLRFDVAEQQLKIGNLPVMSQFFDCWEKRHAPGSFTYSSHQAIFAGFFPTPYDNPKAPRLMALEFPGSETQNVKTLTFGTANIVQGLQTIGYRTMCIGGVGFFNKLTPLGSVMPSLFEHSHWQPEFGVTNPDSTRNQIDYCIEQIQPISPQQRVFLFLNVSAIHQPNHYYLSDKVQDDLDSHAAALRYVDHMLENLFAFFTARSDTIFIICSDHGTAYGEDHYHGHRLAHESVWTVPYIEFLLPKSQA